MLDAAAYPHIFEKVFEFAPYASLLALRAASRDLRRRVDAKLAAGHIVIRCEGKNAPWHVRLPAFRDWKGGALNLACEAVDLVGFPASRLLREATRIPTARYMYNTTGERDIQLDSLPERERRFDATIDTYVVFAPLPHLLKSTVPYPARRPLRRVVRNITLHPADEFAGHPNASVKQLFLIDESVWIFHLADTPTRAAASWVRDKQTMDAAAMLGRAFETVHEEVRAGTKVTLVGLADLPPLEVKNRTVSSSNLLAKVLGEDDADVELFPLAEYRARVGPERAALETVARV